MIFSERFSSDAPDQYCFKAERHTAHFYFYISSKVDCDVKT
jgi:hypothetical protein